MIQRISKYRDALMGMAILWIMIHHSNLNLPNPFFGIKRLGYSGVDIFMFVSGLGCAVSLSKKRDMVGFMKRRIIRLYPHYMPILIVFLLIYYPNVSITEWLRNIFGNLTGFSFWSMTGNQFNWYILAILLFYIFTPLFFETINKYDNKGLFVLLFLSFVIGFCCVPAEQLVIAVSRFPIYILGVAAGVKLSAGKEIEDSCTTKVLIIVGGIIGFIMLILLYKYQDIIPTDLYNVFYPCILTTIAIVFLICKLFEMIEKNIIGRKVIYVLQSLGKISLDLYLLHLVFFRKIDAIFEKTYDNTRPFPFSIKNCCIWIIIIAFIIITSYIYNKLISILVNKISKKNYSWKTDYSSSTKDN